MRVGYRPIKATLSACSKRVFMVGGLLVLPFAAKLERSVAAEPVAAKPSQQAEPARQSASRKVCSTVRQDPRATCLRRFLATLHAPVTTLAQDFVNAADDNQLDWRLLPSISVIESGGGKAYRNNNIFGWNNGNEPFPTIRAGLNTVAFKLGRSPLYRNRDVIGKLRLYNPDASYVGKVLDVMNRISPKADVVPSRRLTRLAGEYIYAAD